MAIAQIDPAETGLSVSLRYGEGAIALYAAPDLPYPERRRLTPQEVAAHAAQGVIRLGGVDRVRRHHADLLAANRALVHDEIEAALYDARVAEVLACLADGAPDVNRLNRCIAYDWVRLQAA